MKNDKVSFHLACVSMLCWSMLIVIPWNKNERIRNSIRDDSDMVRYKSSCLLVFISIKSIIRFYILLFIYCVEERVILWSFLVLVRHCQLSCQSMQYYRSPRYWYLFRVSYFWGNVVTWNRGKVTREVERLCQFLDCVCTCLCESQSDHFYVISCLVLFKVVFFLI